MEQTKFMNETADQLSLLPQPNDILSLGDDIEVDDNFSFEGFQIVRGEFFAHSKEPAITFNSEQIYVNTACISKLPETDFVQVLVDKNKKQLAILPCKEDDRDSFIWRSINQKTGKRQPKHITCHRFFSKVCEMMDWNTQYRYKMIGKLVKARGISLFVFDLNSYEVYLRTTDTDGKRIPSRKGILPESWNSEFGLSVEDHLKAQQINIHEDFSVMNVKSRQPMTPPTLDTGSGGAD